MGVSTGLQASPAGTGVSICRASEGPPTAALCPGPVWRGPQGRGRASLWGQLDLTYSRSCHPPGLASLGPERRDDVSFCGQDTRAVADMVGTAWPRDAS